MLYGCNTKNKCKIADSVKIWKRIQTTLQTDLVDDSQTKIFNKRYSFALKPCHFAAFALTPSMNFKIIGLTDAEKISALEYMEDEFSVNFMSVYLKFQAKKSPFSGPIMQQDVINQMSAFEWWKSVSVLHKGILSKKDEEKITQITTAAASSAGVKRMFLTFGLVHLKLRNHLGLEKAAKLTFLANQLNK